MPGQHALFLAQSPMGGVFPLAVGLEGGGLLQEESLSQLCSEVPEAQSEAVGLEAGTLGLCRVRGLPYWPRFPLRPALLGATETVRWATLPGTLLCHVALLVLVKADCCVNSCSGWCLWA